MYLSIELSSQRHNIYTTSDGVCIYENLVKKYIVSSYKTL